MQIERILQAARKAGASDIHLVAGIPPAFRVNGEILMADADALSRDDTRELTKQLLSAEQWGVFEREREICVSVLGTSAGRIRMTGYLHAGNPETSIRLCQLEIPTAEELGLPRVIDELTRRPNGLILVTGPTGVGKTTTLNYMVDLINRDRRCKIVTIEDPVEYVHTPKRAIIVQQEVHTDTPCFARALRHVLRQDPNIIVIGEMRDLDTIETALIAAETGHLVIATLHTPNAEQTVERVVGVFPADRQNQVVMQFAGCLQGIIAQVLLPRADRKGRVLATEIMLASNAVRNLIRERNHHMMATTMQTAARDGMKTMDAALSDLYQQGVITWDVATSHARAPQQFQKRPRGGEEG
ncbi:MAG: PilT/PilU family type 4a pilus ATPase [Planctomycetes bacterium]|nr:PilT/PilU family type 4a pilus ATPase [Planctomycetota bacterium]